MTLSLKKDIQKHIVSYGDYALAAPGEPLFTCVGSGRRRKIIYNVLPGQIVAYTVRDGVSTIVDGSTLEASDIYEIYIGVGIDSNGDGMTDDVRHIGIEHISGCLPKEVSTSSPRCGSPEVVDFYFDCTQCDETYSVMVKVDDNKTRSFSPWNKSFAQFVGSVVTECHSCDDCPVEHNCKEVACKLADALNGELDLRLGNGSYPDWKGSGLPRPYFVTRLHENSLVYCLAPKTEDDSCEDCTYIDAITGATINGKTYEFVGTTNPKDSSQTLLAQVESVVIQLNDAFIDAYSQGQEDVNPHAGSAYVTGSYQKCCPLQLHVNTCDVDFELTGATPVVESNPFEDHGGVTSTLDCIDCGDDPVTQNFNCGIRVIAEQLKGSCECFIDLPLAFYGRKIDIVPFGEGWSGKPWKVVKVQSMELPSGFGSWIQWLEYNDLPEGRGRRWDRSNTTKGRLNLPGKKARVRNAVTAECDTNYCSYYIKSLVEKNNINGSLGYLTLHSNIHIPSNDSTTVESWETFFEALIGFNPTCKMLTTVKCDTELSGCSEDDSTPTPSPTPSAPTPSPTPSPTPAPTPAPTPTPAP